ncbi:MAG TPA: transcriptional regulator [Sphingobium sp.]|nr:transcriptional regulator [Sphingobium sp.]
MTKTAFDKIAAGLTDAIAYAKGDATQARVAAPLDVRAIREATHRSQGEFATTYQIPIGTLRDWEQQRRRPDAPARTLLTLIQRDPEAVARMLA